MKELLSEKGTIYVHCDWRVVGFLRLMMDEIFGHFENQICWKRSAIATNVKTQWRNSHDVILFYSKSGEHNFNVQYGEYSESSKLHFSQKDEKGVYSTVPLMASGRTNGPSGQPWRGIDVSSRGKNGMHWLKDPDTLEQLDKEGRIYWPDKGDTPRLKYYLSEAKGVYVPDFWDDITVINSMAKESVGYATQKPEKLLERIINASSNEGDLVADFFIGSGTTLAMAEKLGRRWIGVDLGRYSIHTTRKRLMGIENCRPFEILNLGKYERQIWQGISFNGKDKQTILFEYYAFILKLYSSEPISGFTNIHGKKGKSLVHIGAVDTPVTINEIQESIKECIASGLKELHILGWEWEMGIHDLIENEAKKDGIKLILKLIPNEVMESTGVDSIRFFDLAYLKTKPSIDGMKVKIELTDFVVQNTELIPEEIKSKITKWSDFIDYWAIDFDFKNDTFINQWTSFRTKTNRILKLSSDQYSYKEKGKHRILVKVIDIFGIDTSQIIDVEVK